MHSDSRGTILNFCDCSPALLQRCEEVFGVTKKGFKFVTDWLATGFANVTTWTSTFEVIPFQSARLSIQLDTRLPSSGIIRFSRIPIGKDWPRIEPARLVFRIPVQTNKHIVWRMSANSLIFSSKIYHNEVGSLYFSGRFWCIPGGWLGRELVARVMKTYPVLWTY